MTSWAYFAQAEEAPPKEEANSEQQTGEDTEGSAYSEPYDTESEDVSADMDWDNEPREEHVSQPSNADRPTGSRDDRATRRSRSVASNAFYRFLTNRKTEENYGYMVDDD